jgi:outer membrane protein assembly factor BamB
MLRFGQVNMMRTKCIPIFMPVNDLGVTTVITDVLQPSRIMLHSKSMEKSWRRVFMRDFLWWAVLLPGLVHPPLTQGAAGQDDLQALIHNSGMRGGMVVYLGCEDGASLASLYRPPAMTLHGLAWEADHVEAARAHLKQAGLYGPVSVDRLQARELPYRDNLINLLVAEHPRDITPAEMLRVLVPNGMAIVREQGAWHTLRKPRSPLIDDWTHFLHDASNNAVAQDHQVAPPRSLQWQVAPLWLRSHETPSGFQAAVTGQGRIFYILDEGLIGITDERLPDRWSLYARDAFNGRLLWKRALGKWGWREWALEKWSGKDWTRLRASRVNVPDANHRRLVVDGDRLYTTLNYRAPVSVLDAATGATLHTLPGSDQTQEILVHRQWVVLRLAGEEPGLAVFDKQSGRALWRTASIDIASCLLAAAGEQVCYYADKKLTSVRLDNGQTQWSTAVTGQAQTLVAQEQALLLLGGNRLAAYDPADGHTLWQETVLPRQGWESRDLFVIDGLVWTGTHHVSEEGASSRKSPHALALGRDLLTGQVKKRVLAPNLRSPEHHHRCYRNKATSRYLISSYEGAEFLDMEADNHLQHNWTRGACTLGMMPANGLLYVPPDQCFCSPGAKLLGLTALAGAEAKPSAPLTDDQRLEPGPAYRSPILSDTASVPDGGWPTFRANASRQGSTGCRVPADVTQAWATALGGRLTAPVAWDDQVYVARSDQYTLYALDRQSGRVRWSYTTGGVIDSPPTIHGGRVLCGSKDGYVYCLRAADGVLVWRFLAARENRRVGAFDRLESAWPVHGSILVLDDVAYCTAGRSTYLDGGILLYGLDIPTGRVRYRGQLAGPHRAAGERNMGFFSPGANSDILTAEDGYLYMRQLKLTPELQEISVPVLSNKGAQDVGMHIFSTAGMLDDSWYNRTYWMYSRRWPGFQLANQAPKAGQLLVVDDTRTYAVRAFYRRNVHSPMFFPGQEGYLLFADRNTTEPQIYGEAGSTEPVAWLPQSSYSYANKDPKTGQERWIALDQRAYEYDKGVGYTRSEAPLWSTFLPIRIKAMVKTRDTLFVAGAPDTLEADDPYAAFEGRRGATLAAVSGADGRELMRCELPAPPVFDGLIAAYGQLFLSLRDGRVICMRGSGPAATDPKPDVSTTLAKDL